MTATLTATEAADAFAALFGAARGHVELDTLLSRHPTELARQEHRSFWRKVNWRKVAALIELCERHRASLPERPLLADLYPGVGALALRAVWDERLDNNFTLLQALGMPDSAARNYLAVAHLELSNVGAGELQDIFTAGGEKLAARMRERAVGLCGEAFYRRCPPLDSDRLELLFAGVLVGPGGFASMSERVQLGRMLRSLSVEQRRQLMRTALAHRGQLDDGLSVGELRERIAAPCARALLDDAR